VVALIDGEVGGAGGEACLRLGGSDGDAKEKSQGEDDLLHESFLFL
jgi:hypothetical protein